MRLLRVSGMTAAAVLLAGCALLLTSCAAFRPHPPKFDSEITCPEFHARGVAVYVYDDALLSVLYPDYSRVKVDRTQCVIKAVK